MVACHKDSALDNPQPEEWVADGSPVSIKLGVKIPDPIEVATRAVDPDGNGIQTMTLFCFNGEGLLISTATATIEPNPEDPDNESGGIFDADIPNTTRFIHLLANQNMAQFKETDFRNLTEDQVIANLEGSSGMMIYWARLEIPGNVVGNDGILDWITIMTNPVGEDHNGIQGQNQPIIMLRNQAKVMVDAGGTADAQGRKWNGTYFSVTGFTVVNTQAFGTVAPYHTTYGYPTYACTSSIANYTFTPSFGLTSGSTANWRGTNYVNLPRRSDKFSNITDVDTAPQTYVFETENSSADPVSVIIKGRNAGDTKDKYYRVTLTDSDGEQVLVRRNHLYTIHIKGELLYGVDTFAEALDAPATNNVWLSISDEIKSVQNSDFKLTVDQTSVVIDDKELATLKQGTTPAQVKLTFSVEKLGTGVISANDLQISWVGDQDVSSTYTFGQGSYSFNTTNGKGEIYVNLNDLADDKNEGTILVKYGHLQRKIKVIVLKQQKFTPTWVTSQVYTSTGSTSSNATLVFTIPHDCPAELFPMNVLISTNELDVRYETGQVLPIIRKGEDGYGVDNGIGYKYVYEVTKPGEQFVYMESILSQTSGASTPITIEAEHFESVTKQVVYAEHQRAITVTNVTSSDTATGKDEDKIYYVYLPQKKNAPWAINLKMMNTDTKTEQSVGQWDEFLLYSQNLDAYADSETTTAKKLLPNDPWLSANNNPYFPCQFTTINEESWGTGGRVHAFMPRYQYFTWANTSENASYKSHFSIYMKTNKAKSAEIIRISSNQLEAKAAFKTSFVYHQGSMTDIYEINDGTTKYRDKVGTVSTYRSMVFELRNYPAFRFAAQVTGATGEAVPEYAPGYKDLSDNEEANTPVQIAYVPGTEVDVAFDVTSFIEEEDDDKNNAEVDPFGTAFDIFIQTPGLELAEGEGENAKITKVDDTGLYKYTVDANRTTEAVNWDTNALQSNIDGERKVITFKTKEIVTEGDIVIYTDPEKISYKTKTFNVTNAPISGNITCSDGTTVPQGQFVSFSRELDGSRIGSVTVTADGQYQLRLRKEYEFTWNQNDPVKFYAKIGGSYYTATLNNLEELYNNHDIMLEKESTVGE